MKMIVKLSMECLLKYPMKPLFKILWFIIWTICTNLIAERNDNVYFLNYVLLSV